MAVIYDLFVGSLDQQRKVRGSGSLLWLGWLSSLSTATSHKYMQIQNKNRQSPFTTIFCTGYETEEDDESDVEICRKLRKKRGKSVSSGSRGKSLCQPDSDDQQDFR